VSVVNVEIREKGEGSNYGHEAGEATHIFSSVVVSYTSVDSPHPAARYRPLGEKRMHSALEGAGLVTTRRIGDESRSSHRTQPNQSDPNSNLSHCDRDSPTSSSDHPWIIILEYICVHQIDVNSALRDMLAEGRYPC
jgi:hypothetical protein